jgi:arylsulfatase A-like enzyme
MHPDFIVRPVVLLVASVAWFTLSSPVLAEQRRPNVVLIVADDLGWRDLSGQGSTFYESPRIDALAKSGVRFTQGYATCQVCSPSRASLMTGQFPARLRITDWIGAAEGTAWKRNTKLLPAYYRHELPPERVTIAEALNEAGYATFFAGKWHLGDTELDWPEYHGFDVNRGGHNRGSPPGGYFSPYANPRLTDGPPGEYLPLRLGRETADFIEAHADQAFFATLCFYSVHGPAQTTQSLWEKYRVKATSEPQPTARFGEERRRPIREVQDNPIYGGMIEAMDQGVGFVLDALERNNLTENTIVIFTSDNGGVASGDHWATSNLPLRGGKGYQWEGGVRVPFIVAWPAQVAPRVEERAVVIGTDIYPTVLALAGLPLRPTEHLDGVSLEPALRGQADVPERALIWHYPHYGNQGGDPSSIVRRGNWKLIHTYEDGRDELYQMAEDPMETTDVAAKYPDLTVRLRAELDAWLVAAQAELPVINPDYDPVAAAVEREREMTTGKAQQERRAVEMLSLDWVPDGGWWEAREPGRE